MFRGFSEILPVVFAFYHRPMSHPSRTRIESIDLLKGLVMVVMVLDHARDYFHYSAFFFDPTDPELTTWPIYITRWVTNFCAPAFSFLAGLSAYLVGKRKSPAALSQFLLKRGLWLVFIEVVVISFGWKFDLTFHHIGLQTIWSLGVSMIVLAGLIHLPRSVILAFSCILIFGHNLLDSIHFDGSVLWSVLHETHKFEWGGHVIRLAYPLIPLVGVMSLGYVFGSLYDPSFEAARRKRILNQVGIRSLVLFLGLIILNQYGDPVRWTHYPTISQTLMSIFDTTKYTPSLLFLLITLGPSFLFLANSETWKGRWVQFFCTFGRVPFFFYILHIYLLHFLALWAARFTGFGWKMWGMPTFVTRVDELKGFGFPLWVVYVVWIGTVLLLYPLCKKFDAYKQANKEKSWLSYL